MPRSLKHILLCLLGLALFSALCVRPAFAEPRIIKISGKAEIMAHGTSRWAELKKQATLKKGDAIRVNTGHVTLRDNETKTGVTVGPNSQLGYAGNLEAREGMQRPAASKAVPCYTLPQGEAEVNVTPGHSLDLITPLILTSVRGTRYQAKVRLDGSSSVKVLEGIVHVRDRLGVERSLRAGESHSLSTRDYISAIQKLPRLQRAPRAQGGGSGGASEGGSGGASEGGSGGASEGGSGDDGGDDD